MNLHVDPNRMAEIETGILVRANYNGKFISTDISSLDAASLLAWLRSRGGKNVWAENVVGTLLGHNDAIAKEI